MAISLVAHLGHTDFQNLGDPLRILQSFDYTFSDQMEFSPHANNNQELTSQYRHYAAGSNAPAANSGANFQGYNQVVDFVDSPPNSKDAWSDEYPKAGMSGPTILDVQSIQSNNRKRRMDWDSLNVNSNGTNSPQGESKLQNFGPKDREKRKATGRGSWADDIDFDLNAEFTNNGYLHNEAFLSALTVLKQEIPSPNGEIKKTSRSPHHGKSSLLNQQLPPEKPQQHSNAINSHQNNETNTNNSQQGHDRSSPLDSANQQISQPMPEQEPRPNSGNSISGFQQILSQSRNFENSSATNSPNHPEIIVAKGDTSSDEFKFQYILAAATSIATKNNEDTLTYLNQGQSYEIKLKKLGDLSQYKGKILKSIIKICFHERRLQYMEREQMQQWQASRPGERIVEVDVPLSYGLCHVSQPLGQNLLNIVEVSWDPMKEVGVYIKVNCISTEFTPKKHGGEKGVPFRIQIETYFDNGTENSSKPIHAAACQIKVFKLKGADRKHKQDREKIQKRPLSEQEKYQPSYDCTILNDIPLESVLSQDSYSPEYIKPTVSPLMPTSPIHIPKYDGIISFANNTSPVAINSVTSTNPNNYKILEQNLVSPQQVDMEEHAMTVTKDSTPAQVAQWMTFHRLNPYVATFAHFSGSDILRMSKEDLIQICGIADGIRLFNTLHAKAITPRLTIYVSLDGSSYHAIYLLSNTTKELIHKLSKLSGFYEQIANSGNTDGNGYQAWGMQSKYSGSGNNLHDLLKLTVYVNGPSGIHVLVTDEVLNNIKDDSLFALEIQNGKLLLKATYKNENN